MMKKKLLLIATILSIFFLTVTIVNAETESMTINEKVRNTKYYSGTQTGFGPGSDFPLRTPVESSYVWISSVEPVKTVWTIYQPGLQPVYTFEKTVSYKQRITTGEHAGKWAVADEAVFTIPCFATKGDWLAKPVIYLEDGSTITGVSAENTQAKYIAFSITSSGDFFTNLFGSPWYFLNMRMPPLFWFPMIILWGPALFIGICYASPKISDAFIGGVSKLRESRRKWKN
jgi:hypothetical protein